MGGGGARAAYQVGVLRGLARQHPELHAPILTGVSAGAINTAFLANRPEPIAESAAHLAELWNSLRTEDVIESNAASLFGTAFRWGLRLVSGGSKLAPPTKGMVDTTPLRGFLRRALETEDGRLHGIRKNLEARRVRAVGLTTTDYATARTVTYIEGRDVSMWKRPHRSAVETDLTVDHVMASAALPLFFPAIRIGDRWHGDGGIRLTSPLAPALHLGAERILAISTRYPKKGHEVDRPDSFGYPSPARVLGVLMNAIFLDALDYDALTMSRINDLLRLIPPEKRGDLRVAELLILRPSKDLARMATKFEPRLPQPFRFLTRGLGTRETRSPDSLSMIMFEPDYVNRLMDLGEEDAAAHSAEISAFLAGEGSEAVQKTGFWRI
jgi:NTE family protein